MWKKWCRHGIKARMTRKIEISHRTIIFTVLFLLFLWFLYYVRDVIMALFIALLIMTILNPIVTRLSKYKIPRLLSILVVYILVFATVGFAIASIVPPLLDQTTSFVESLPLYIQNMGLPENINEQLASEVGRIVSFLPGAVARTTVSIFSNLVNTVAVLAIALYLLLERDKLDDHLGNFFGGKQVKRAGKVIDSLEKKLGGWARGQFAIMLIVGVMTYAGLKLLGIPFALPLAIMAGLLEIVPYIGPTIAAVPVAIAGFSVSSVMGLAAIILALSIQQLEGLLITPKVLEKSLGVSPIITLLVIAMGSRLMGIVGVLIAVPVVITSRILLKEFVFK